MPAADAGKEDKAAGESTLNYQNTATPVHPLIVQLYRCELDDNNEETQKKAGDGGENEKNSPDPIFRAEEHDRQVLIYYINIALCNAFDLLVSLTRTSIWTFV